MNWKTLGNSWSIMVDPGNPSQTRKEDETVGYFKVRSDRFILQLMVRCGIDSRTWIFGGGTQGVSWAMESLRLILWVDLWFECRACIRVYLIFKSILENLIFSWSNEFHLFFGNSFRHFTSHVGHVKWFILLSNISRYSWELYWVQWI